MLHDITPDEIQQQLERIKQGGEERDKALYSIASSRDCHQIGANPF
jgi:hypothetical protein